MNTESITIPTKDTPLSVKFYSVGEFFQKQ